MKIQRGAAAVVGGILLNLAFGGLYAYSAMVPGLEHAGILTRTDTAMVFALSTTSFMIGVWGTAHLLRHWCACTIAMVAGVGASIGLFICAWVPSLGALVVGYSGIYGVNVGVGYALSLAGLAQVPLKRPGAAAGIVVAAFAIGSVCWAQALGQGIARVGISITLSLSAFVVAVLACVAAFALRVANSIDEPWEEITKAPIHRFPPGKPVYRGPISLLTLWLTFFAVASAGLTVISQALQLLDTQSRYVILGLSVVAIAGGANGAGRLFGGALVDQLSPTVLLGTPLVLTTAGLGVLFTHGHSPASYCAILLIALMYGWCSAVVPAVVMKDAGEKGFAAIYGRIFTAWGSAGLLAPWAAGWVFSQYGTYDLVLIALSLLNVLALGIMCLQAAKGSVIQSNQGYIEEAEQSQENAAGSLLRKK